jgi:phage terminase large subunit GpA-like protein
MFAAQLGKSETGNNLLGYIIDKEPGPVMIVQPTTDMAKRFSRHQLIARNINVNILQVVGTRTAHTDVLLL